MIKWILIIFLVFFIISCTKEVRHCSQDKVIGKYYCAESNSTINVDFHFSSGNNLHTYLPKIASGNSYYNFDMSVELVQDGCSFVLGSFYDNYAKSNSGPHFWLTGKGSGYFEKDKMALSYNVKINATNLWNTTDTMLVNKSFSSVYVKID
jgi:hypothetical protein